MSKSEAVIVGTCDACGLTYVWMNEAKGKIRCLRQCGGTVVRTHENDGTPVRENEFLARSCPEYAEQLRKLEESSGGALE